MHPHAPTEQTPHLFAINWSLMPVAPADVSIYLI